MTNIAILNHLKTHKQMYTTLANNCVCVNELLLKLQIFNYQWKTWDWVLFFNFLVIHNIFFDSYDENISINVKSLITDIINTIDNNTDLDDVFKNRNIILAFLDFCDSDVLDCIYSKNISVDCKLYSLQILAHVFKKFPALWSMNWMWYTRHLPKSKMLVKRHRMHKYIKHDKDDINYFISNQSLIDFTNKYYN